MLQRLASKGISQTDRFAQIRLFFESTQFRSIPTARIASLFWATLAREIHSGRSVERFPNAGFCNDIDIVSSYSLTCDAMFVDREMSHLSKQGQLRQELRRGAKLYSLQKDEKASFLDYLAQIEKDAPGEHLNLVKQVYGDTWSDPFVELLNQPVDRCSVLGNATQQIFS